MFEYAICCAIGAIFAKGYCCSNNQDISERTRKMVRLLKCIILVLVVAGAITTAAVLGRNAVQDRANENKVVLITTMENDFPDSVSTTLKTSLTEPNITGTMPAFSTTTTVTIASDPTTFLPNCPEHLNNLSNVQYSEQIGCIWADIEDMTYQSFDEALNRCKYLNKIKCVFLVLCCSS